MFARKMISQGTKTRVKLGGRKKTHGDFREFCEIHGNSVRNSWKSAEGFSSFFCGITVKSSYEPAFTAMRNQL